MANGQAVISVSASGPTVLIPGQERLQIQVTRLILALEQQTTVQFLSGSTPLSGQMPLVKLGLDQGSPQDAPFYVCNSGEDFVISLGDAVNGGGTVYFQYL